MPSLPEHRDFPNCNAHFLCADCHQYTSKFPFCHAVCHFVISTSGCVRHHCTKFWLGYFQSTLGQNSLVFCPFLIVFLAHCIPITLRWFLLINVTWQAFNMHSLGVMVAHPWRLCFHLATNDRALLNISSQYLSCND